MVFCISKCYFPFLIKLLMCVVSDYDLGLWTAMEKALILSRDLIHSNQGADGIFVESK